MVFTQEVSFRLVEITLGVALILQGYGLLALAAVHAISWMIQSIVGISIVRRKFVPTVIAQWHRNSAVQLVNGGLPFVVAVFLFGWLLHAPIILFPHATGDEASLGQLTLALQVFVLIGSVVGELGIAAIPVLGRSTARKDGKARQFIEAVFRGGWLLSGIFMVDALTLATSIVDTLFGADYGQVSNLLPWAAGLIGPLFLANCLRSVQIAEGRYKAVVISNLAGAAVLTISFFPFVALFDLHGVFIALGFGFLALIGTQLWDITQTYPLDWYGSIYRPLLAVVITVVGCQILSGVSWWLGLLGGITLLLSTSITFGILSWSEICETVLSSK